MNRLYRIVHRVRDAGLALQRIFATLRRDAPSPVKGGGACAERPVQQDAFVEELTREDSYAGKLAQETAIYKDVKDINVLPQIFHYWSNTYVRALLEEVGASNPDEFFAKYLHESSARCETQFPVFISIGAGNCDTEVRVARLLKNSGLAEFTIECLDMNPHMLARGRQMAELEGVAGHIATIEGDFNSWAGTKRYHGAIANQSLHHVMNLEGLFDEIKRSLHPNAYFITSDMIGRNGHQRWPEALSEVQRFWQELPNEYRYNRQLNRLEDDYENWDCSKEGFEGVRAQDILPLLLTRFHMHVFIAFANVVDVFVDRAFGHNFNGDGEWDRQFVDRLHAFDEEGLQNGNLTPTHLMAVMTKAPIPSPFWSRGLSPTACVRRPDQGATRTKIDSSSDFCALI